MVFDVRFHTKPLHRLVHDRKLFALDSIYKLTYYFQNLH